MRNFIRTGFFPLLLSSALFFSNCKKENAPVDPDFPDDCYEILGYFELLPSSFQAIPYEGINRVVFQDTFGNDLVLQLVIEDHFKQPITFWYQDTVTNQRNRYCWYYDKRRCTLNNDSLQLFMTLSLLTSLNIQAPEEKYIHDLLSISLKQEGVNPISSTIGLHLKTINKRNNPDTIQPTILPLLICNGREFQNVEYTVNPSGSHFYFYYHDLHGVVAFKTADGKKWRFDRFE